MNENLEIYYSNRAKEYEEIYLKPERQIELRKIEKSKSILALDINDSVLEIAKNKSYPNNNVRFQKENLFSYKSKRKFEGLFGGFIWSHIKLQELDDFIETANNFVISEGIIVFIDNYYIEGSSHPITNNDEFGNTYQTRKLKDDSSHLVLKNFPSNEFILDTLKDKAKEISFVNLKYYWIVNYKK